MAIVGIDLGTTNSLVAVMTAEGPEVLVNELGDALTPSAVAIAEDGAVLVGRAARDRLVVEPRSGRAFFKRDMGTETTYEFGGRRWTPTECSAHVLAELKRVASVRLGEPVTRAVVTVPAYFHEPQRRATLEAAGIAGLVVERILNEPTAAALAYGYRSADEEKRLLVFDLGGGTFDVTVLETFEGIVEVRASGGDSHLGGEDYTDSLLDLSLKGAGLVPTPGQRSRWRQRAEVAKRALSEQESVEIDLDGRRVPVLRGAFEGATAAITARLRPVVRRCLRDAGIAPADLDDVLFVGGATRMPAVIRFAVDEFGRMPNRRLDPDRVVALGAAVQAARSAKDAVVKDLVLTDVCPHTLGIEVSKQHGDARHEPGHFAPILDRNVTVPASRVEGFSTLHPDQDRVEIRVFQGESRRTAENTFLGSLAVNGLRSRPGQKCPGEFEVRFSYDANGVLEVEVTVLHSGERHVKVIESRPGALTRAQVAAAVERLQPLKVRSRDLLPHRARLERAERLWAELTGDDRARLGAALDAYESALAVEDADRIGFSAAVLDDALKDAYAAEGEAPPGPGAPGP